MRIRGAVGPTITMPSGALGIAPWALLLAAGSLSGCDARERPLGKTPASMITDGEAAVGVQPVQSTGPVPLKSWVRAVNSYGASVASEPQRVSVDGAQSLLSFDGVGYGAVTLDTTGVRTVASLTDTVTSYVLPGWYEPPGLLPSAPALLPSPDMAYTVSTGVVAVDGTDVWWVDHAGQRPHRVLSLQEDILGLRVGSIDVDGVDDALVWTSSAVYLLRGRPDGGMAWGGGFRAPGHTVGGADMGDLSADNLPDIAIGWAGGELGGVVDVWNGDGLFGFEAAEPRNVSGRPVSVAVDDNTGEGRAQVTVMLAEGRWARFIEGAPSRYMPIGPETPDQVLLSGGSVLGERIDLDGDGAAEVPVFAPRVDGQKRPLTLFGVDEGVLILAYEDEQAAYTASGDGDGDLVDDLWVHQETGELQVLYYEREGAVESWPRTTVLRETPSHGPVSVYDLDGDEDNDLWLGGDDVWWWFRGRNYLGDPERFWEIIEPERVFVREALQPPVRVGTLDADPATNHLLAFHNDGTQQLFMVLEDLGGERADRIGAVSTPGGPPVDLAICGQRAYALLTSSLYSIDLTDRTRPTIAASLPVTDPRDITCGTGPGGASVGLLDGDALVLMGPTLSEVSRAQSPDAHGVAFVDLGTGPEARVCNGAGCGILGWTLGDGITRVIVADDGGMRAFAPDGSYVELGGLASELSLQDIDLDGRPELLTLDEPTGLVGLYRDLDTVIAPPQLWHVGLGWEGGVLALDGDRDGTIDLWGIDSETDALRYLVLERPEPEPVDSGDTGATGSTADTATAGSGGATAAVGTGDTAPHGTGGTGSSLDLGTGDTGP